MLFWCRNFFWLGSGGSPSLRALYQNKTFVSLMAASEYLTFQMFACSLFYSPPLPFSPSHPSPQVVLEDENTIENILIEQQPSPSEFRGLKHFNSNFAKVSIV